MTRPILPTVPKISLNCKRLSLELRSTKTSLERARQELEAKCDRIRILEKAAAKNENDFRYGFLAGSIVITGISILILRFS
jgi:hypothetical protein